jgi:hypothetical protein
VKENTETILVQAALNGNTDSFNRLCEQYYSAIVAIAFSQLCDRDLLTGFEKLNGEFRAYDFQWNAELSEGIFEPNISDDFTEFKITDFIPVEAKAGLVGLVAIPAGFVFWKRRRKKAATALC